LELPRDPSERLGGARKRDGVNAIEPEERGQEIELLNVILD
jgi:hypothetical protein